MEDSEPIFLNQYWFLLCEANFILVSDQFGWLFFEPFGHSQKQVKSIEWPCKYEAELNDSEIPSFGVPSGRKPHRKKSRCIFSLSFFFFFSIKLITVIWSAGFNYRETSVWILLQWRVLSHLLWWKAKGDPSGYWVSIKIRG